MTQAEASAALGVRAQTLYAYVSRGRIKVCTDPAHPRRSLYSADDVGVLLRRRDRGRTRDGIAASTMSWGEPIIATQISTVLRGRLYYRGRNAIDLAATATLELAAMLLWDAETAPCFPATPSLIDHPMPRARACATLGLAAAEGLPAHALSPGAMRQESAALVGRLAAAFVDLPPGTAPLHAGLARAWGCDTQAPLLRRALVLLADQELTSSAFAARVTASTGASLGAAALSGLCALSGPLHGDATIRVQALVEDAQRSGAEGAVRRWMEAGLILPGFGHTLYPEGDPRAADLLDAFRPSATMRSLIEAAFRLTGLRPTIDVALAALAEHCGLREGSAFTLFAIGRSVGWMAHAMEQVQTGTLLRPRARYVGAQIAEG